LIRFINDMGGGEKKIYQIVSNIITSM